MALSSSRNRNLRYSARKTTIEFLPLPRRLRAAGGCPIPFYPAPAVYVSSAGAVIDSFHNGPPTTGHCRGSASLFRKSPERAGTGARATNPGAAVEAAPSQGRLEAPTWGAAIFPCLFLSAYPRAAANRPLWAVFLFSFLNSEDFSTFRVEHIRTRLAQQSCVSVNSSNVT